MKKKAILIGVLLAIIPLLTMYGQSAAGGGKKRVVQNYTLTITSNVPSAVIYINGTEQKGRTPFRIQLSPGRYTVLLRAPGYSDGTSVINLDSDQNVYIPLRPSLFSLKINSNVTSADIYINGSRQNGTPPYRANLAPGTYSIVLKAPGYSDGTSVINLDSDQNVYIPLGPSLFSLKINSNVTTADIYINGALQNGTPPYRTNLAPGTYSIVLKAPGYSDGSSVVSLDSDQNVYIALQPVLFSLMITSNVTTADIYINGALQNGTPPYRTNLAPGTYSIVLKAPGYSDGSAVVNLNSKENIHIQLKPAMATVVPIKPHPGAKIFIRIGNHNFKEITEPMMLTPGRYTFRYSIGSLTAEQEFVVTAGHTYKLEPVLQLKLQE